MTDDRVREEDLVERLRNEANRRVYDTPSLASLAREAATVIEAAEARVRELEAELSDQRAIAKYNREQAESAERRLAEAYERAAMAVADEHLTDSTGTSDDIAYDTAIDHSVNAVRKLAQEVKS